MKKILVLIALSLFTLQITAQKGLKAIRIQAPVNLTSGLTIPKGSIIVISEGYANVSATVKDSIPCQVATKVYASFTDYNDGKLNIPAISIQDFNPSFNNLKMPVSGYKESNTQDLLISVVYGYLETIYHGKIEVITL